MAFIDYIFKMDLPKDPFEREVMIDAEFDQFFRTADYSRILPSCPWGMHAMVPAKDMELAGGMQALIDSYVNLKIGVVFPGTTITDFLNMPHFFAAMLRKTAQSEEGKQAINSEQERKALQVLERETARKMAQTK